MTRFHLVDPSPSTVALSELLVRHGATPAGDGALIVVAASSVAQARERLARLTGPERARCLIVGVHEALDRLPSPDNLPGLLDEFLPLGVLRFGEPWRGDAFDFIGKKSLAEAVGVPYGKRTTSRHYAGYMKRRGEDAGAFVLRYVRAAAAGSALPGDAYVAYLITKDRAASAQALDDALVAVGRSEEGALWRAWCAGESRAVLTSGAWRDRTVHLDVSPPPRAEIGHLWFDLCELSLMVHAGRAWLATRPTGLWQLRGFLDVAPRTSSDVETHPSYPVLDRDRLLSGVDESAATHLTCGEAMLYARWFGKTVPHLLDWQSATEHLPPDQAEALWTGSAKEWTSVVLAEDAAARVFATPATIREDPREFAQDETRAASMVTREDTYRWDLGFRTAVVLEQGLSHADPSSLPAIDGIQLASLLDRDAFR